MNSFKSVLVLNKSLDNKIRITLFSKAKIHTERILNREILGILEVTRFFKIKKTFKIISSYVFGDFPTSRKLLKVTREYDINDFKNLELYDSLIKMPNTKMIIKEKIMRYVRKIIEINHNIEDVRLEETDEDSDDDSTGDSTVSGNLVLSLEQRMNLNFLKSHSSWNYSWIMYDRVLYEDGLVCGNAVGDFIIDRSPQIWVSSSDFKRSLEPTTSRISSIDKYKEFKKFKSDQLPLFYESGLIHIISVERWKLFNEGKFNVVNTIN